MNPLVGRGLRVQYLEVCRAKINQGYSAVTRSVLVSLVLAVAAFAAVTVARALDHVTLRRDNKETTVEGRTLVTAQDGGILLEGRDGVLWPVTPEEQVKVTSDKTPFAPLSREELARQLLAGLPRGFEVHETQNYLILYNTSKGYAQWCGSLFERLFLAFNNYWERRGFQLAKPEFPLVAIVFAERSTYVKYSQPELGEAADAIIGYFSLRTNRMTMYDLTGVEQFARTLDRRASAAQINQILARPDAERTVATIVHEATHQIAFNCGLHQRFSDCPLWFSEGIAVYFEAPDLNSSKGWKTIGAVNRVRLEQFRSYLKARPADSLVSLISKDDRLRGTKTAPDAYAEAWALTYFLNRQRPKEYVDYLSMLSKKKPLFWDDPEARLSEFKAAFGEDLGALDAEFLRFMAKVR